MELIGREKALVSRGYSEEEVASLSYVSPEETRETVDRIIARITDGVHRVKNPSCVMIGGQPGSGKSTLMLRMKNSDEGSNSVTVAMDDYRSYHPRYLEIEEAIRKHWEGRTETDIDSAGNDIACFTQRFAGEAVDTVDGYLTSFSEDGAYNIIFEWAMKEPEEPLEFMRTIAERGYRIDVIFMAVPAEVSRNACVLRADIMNSKGHVFRRIPRDFHDLSVSSLPASCDVIYREGCAENGIIQGFSLLRRDDSVLWQNGFPGTPGPVYKECLESTEGLEGYINHPEEAGNSYNHEAAGLLDA